MRHLDNFLERLRNVRRQGAGWRACCPAHDDRDASMSISLGEGNRILFNCHACGRDRKPLILKAMGLAWRDTYAKGKDYRVKATEQAARPAVALTPDAVELHNKAYSFMGGRTGLTEEHANDLIRRGLFRGHVHSDGYFSIEKVSQSCLGRLLIDMGEELYDVPGFWSDVAGRPRLGHGSGLFIPVRDEGRRIISGQIRTGGDPKYVWLRGSGSPRHVPLYAEIGDTVWVTEGPLKADISSLLSGFPVIGIAGVAAWRGLLPALSRWGVKRVVIAFDADWREKPPVAEQLQSFSKHLITKGYEVDWAEWDIALGKGLDDLLAAGFSPQIREAGRGSVSADRRVLVGSAAGGGNS